MPRKAPLDEILSGIESASAKLPIGVALVFPLALVGFTFWAVGIVFGAFEELPLVQVEGLQIIPWVAAGFVGLLSTVAVLRGNRKRRERKMRFLRTQSADQLKQLHWREFELLVADHFRLMGYRVVEGVGNAPDGGIDLQLQSPGGQRVLVQCKHYRSRRIGVKVVREMLGVLQKSGADAVMIVGAGSFTQEAREFAKGQPVELVDGSEFLQRKAGGDPIPALVESRPNTEDSERCPRCGSPLVQRVAKRGSNAGMSFLGCSGFPDCRYSRNL